jgi:phospholipase C
MRPTDTVLLAAAALALSSGPRALATGNLDKVNHIIVVMQENHSFDNYFGVLAYAPGSLYHNATGGACAAADHRCVDGLTCAATAGGGIACANANPGSDGSPVAAFHSPSRCTDPDLDHSWVGTHAELDFALPNKSLTEPRSDGFVRVNGGDAQAMSYFDQTDLPFYYGLAQTFAISDRYFSAMPGPTIPNRMYAMAATSFGHLTTDDVVPPAGGYKPITGTIFDLLDKAGISWGDYFQDLPQAVTFRPGDKHELPLATFLAEASGTGKLPSVSFVDPNFGIAGFALENDEHPPTDIQRGQAYVAQVVNAVRNGPHWKDSIIFIAYDEHGGFYDHARPPAARQAGQRTPDGIAPGQCADLSNPPASLRPGNGAECAANFVSGADTDVRDAEALCPALTKKPAGPFPAACASFDQVGVRVPFIAVSPFSRPGYVSHVATDHTSILALIEARFLTPAGGTRQHLTARDQNAGSLLDLFDFTGAPSLNAAVGAASPPATDCTPAGGGSGLP